MVWQDGSVATAAAYCKVIYRPQGVEGWRGGGRVGGGAFRNELGVPHGGEYSIIFMFGRGAWPLAQTAPAT